MAATPIALISDVHANLEALEAVLASIDREGVRQIVCLGDIVGYGPDPEAVVDVIRRRARTCVAGNHDWALLNRPLGFNPLAAEVIRYTRDMMEPKFYQLFGKARVRWRFLESLPDRLEEGDLQFVHASPRDPLMEYVFGDRHPLFSREQLDELFPLVRRICFHGHTHLPGVIREDGVCWYPREGSGTLALQSGRRYLVDVGSVGQPRDGDPRACYAIFDGASVAVRRVPYDVERTRAKILSIDAMEERLADRLLAGR